MGVIVNEDEKKTRNIFVRMLLYHWTVQPIVKSPAREEREKYLFLFWKAVPFNRWQLFASSFLIQFCCGSLYSWSNFNAPIDILIYGTKTANKAPNTFYIAVGTLRLSLTIDEMVRDKNVVPELQSAIA